MPEKYEPGEELKTVPFRPFPHIGGLDIANADDGIQLDELEKVFSTMYEHPAIRSITFWEYIQGRIWSDDAYLLRENGTPRPALIWLTEYLTEVGAR